MSKQREIQEVIEALSDDDDTPQGDPGKAVDVGGSANFAKQRERQEVIELLSDDDDTPQRNPGKAIDVSSVASLPSRAAAHGKAVDRKRKAEKVMQDIERGGKRRTYGRPLGVR